MNIRETQGIAPSTAPGMRTHFHMHHPHKKAALQTYHSDSFEPSTQLYYIPVLPSDYYGCVNRQCEKVVFIYTLTHA